MRTRALALSLLTTLASCDGGSSAQAQPLSSLDPHEMFDGFTRAERWYVHYNLPRVKSDRKRYEVLLPLLEAGDLHAIKKIAYAYELDPGPFGGPRDLDKSFALHVKAAEMGDPGSMRMVGRIYVFGDSYGVEKDYRKAVDWFEKSFDLSNDPDTAMVISRLYSWGMVGNLEKNERKAKAWRAKAEKARQRKPKERQPGDVPDFKRLEAELTEGAEHSVMSRFYEKVFRALEARAGDKSPKAMTELGLARLKMDPFWRATFYGTRGAILNPTEGIALLEEAHELEPSASQKKFIAAQLARSYREGPTAIRDPDKAKYWKQKAR